MKAKLLFPQKIRIDVNDSSKGYELQPVGFVIDHPDAYKLVQHGSAEPDDDECRDAANMTPEQMTHARKSFKRISAGIQPEDYTAFDAGLMIGYDPKGNPIPGPNAEPDEDLEFDEDETDGDEAVTTE